jgi:chitodextrinase
VSVTPATVTVSRGDTQSFTATVTGDGHPAQGVRWSVSGNASAATTIDGTGRLKVASFETKPTLTVIATSTVDASRYASATATVPQPATALTQPSIAGTASVGGLLIADPGTWDVSDATFDYQWSANGTPIAGASGPTLLVTGDLNGAHVTVTVTAHAAGRPDGTATSATALLANTPAWAATTVYKAGDTVLYQGKLYVAQWYAHGDKPGASVWGAWAEQNVQAATAKNAVVRSWTPSWIYTGGETVAYNGHVWKASWWTRNQQPVGDPYGPWQDLGPIS